MEPVPGSTVYSLYTVELIFDRTVTGVDATDLLINGEPATNVVEVAEGQYLFSFTPPSFGQVEVAWAAEAGIRDANGVTFEPAPWSYNLQETIPTAPIQISEFLASNNRGLRDQDGETSDWIELFNPTDEEVDLTGWFLTDTASRLTAWRFPEVVIPAGGYLVVYASEKNLTNPAVPLHTNFKLSDSGEFLALVSPQTNVVSSFAPAYPRQTTDVSYGRLQSDPGIVGFFLKPTPGALNATSGSGFSPEVDFSHSSRTMTNLFQLTLSTAQAQAVIRYTLNGSAPTNTSPVYSGPITLGSNVLVRARSYQEGLLPGPIRTEAFTFMTNNLGSFTSSLPVLVINTFGRSPSASAQTAAYYTLFEPEAGWTSLTNEPTLTTRGSVKLRGSSTEGLSKSSFAVEFWDEANLDKDLSILGLPEDSDWVLYAPNQYDPVMIHNPFIHQLSRDTGMYSSRTRFVEVFLMRVNGLMVSNSYNGIYVLEEKIKIGNDRVDIDKLHPQHTKLPEISGGYLMKIDRLDPGDSGISAGSARVAMIDPKESELESAVRRPQMQYLTGYLGAFGRSLTSTNWRHPELGYPAYIDVDNWIDFHTLEVLSGNVDTLVLSTYFYKPRNGKLTFGPHWDFDRALGSTDGRDSNPRMWSTGPFFSAPWWSKLFTDRDFWQLWVDRWQERRVNYFSNTNINRLIDDLANQVREAQPREQRRWGLAPRGGSYQAEVNLMKNWLSNRMDFIDKQLAVPPRANTESRKVEPGFQLELSAPANNTIYYTLDGTDPRLSQGNISSNAILYTGPIEISSNTLVIARSRNTVVRQTGGPPATTPWSRPIKTTLFTGTSRLTLSELMFHPAVPAAGSPYTAEDFQFIELKNTGTNTIPLDGYTFNQGITYHFDSSSNVRTLRPGERLLLVNNKTAFLERYPTVNPALIAGEFNGSLAFGGETLSLNGPVGEPAFSFAYSDEWHKTADGFGFSLVLADDNSGPEELAHAAAWRVSANQGGSPGVADPARPVIHPVYVSEIISNPSAGDQDAVELMNPNPFEVNISGWWLSDDLRDYRKYQFPAGTYIPARGFMLVGENQFRNATANGFALSAMGDEIYLLSADASGALTGFQHGWEFGPSETGRTYGLYISPEGLHRAAPQEFSTLGRPNGYPAVGPLIITEIMYHPVGNFSAFEYLEVKNMSNQAVPLYDPARPTNLWRISGDVAFTFPAGSVIPTGGTALILGFDPRNFAMINQFRSSIGLIDQGQFFGPWEGNLNNSGGTVLLERPGTPVPDGDTVQVPMLLVDQVEFGALEPWPSTAGGTGLSLVRLGDWAFGNDPSNWTALYPSPADSDRDQDALPDSWEIAHGFDPHSGIGDQGGSGDLDGDGMTNFDELRAGTSPSEAASVLALGHRRSAVNEIELSFEPVIGRAYQVYYSDTLKEGSWGLLRSYTPATSTNTIIIKERPKLRYYKLVIP